VKLSTASIGEWLTGVSVPSSAPAFAYLISELQDRAASRHAPGFARRPLAEWERLRAAAWSERHAHRGGRPSSGRIVASESEASVPEPVGVLLGLACDPFAFEIHPAIDAPPAREAARLELLENESLIRHEQTELAELRDGTRFPSMDSRRRTEEITTLERSLDDRLARVVRLRDQVGDVETVVDANGALPCERRETALSMFSTWRYCEVTRLRKRLDTARTTLKTTDDKAAKSKIRTQISLDECRLKALLAVSRPTADQMCADYPHPVAWDCWSTTGGMAFYAGPCPRWPGWAARVRKAREILMSAPSPAAPAAPRAQPLAVIPSGLPLTELMARLAEIQAAHPDARAMRGRANRWEIWPAEDAAECAPSGAASPPL
jgi:hypothetical protein